MSSGKWFVFPSKNRVKDCRRVEHYWWKRGKAKLRGTQGGDYTINKQLIIILSIELVLFKIVAIDAEYS